MVKSTVTKIYRRFHWLIRTRAGTIVSYTTCAHLKPALTPDYNMICTVVKIISDIWVVFFWYHPWLMFATSAFIYSLFPLYLPNLFFVAPQNLCKKILKKEKLTKFHSLYINTTGQIITQQQSSISRSFFLPPNWKLVLTIAVIVAIVITLSSYT